MRPLALEHIRGLSVRQSSWPLKFSGHARLLAVFGLGLWLAAGICEVWEVLAVQSPDSPFHLGVLAGPVTQLRGHCFGLGTLSVGLACLWSLFGHRAARLAPARTAFLAGASLETLALLWAAASGMLAAQVFDPRPDARLMLYLRALGRGLVLLAGTGFFARAVIGARKP